MSDRGEEQKAGFPTPTGLTRSAPRSGAVARHATVWFGVAVALAALVTLYYLVRG